MDRRDFLRHAGLASGGLPLVLAPGRLGAAERLPGILNDLQTTREQAPWLSDWYRSQGREPRSHGNSYAQSWADVQFQRMPNINLLPYPEADVSLEELASGIERGILIEGPGSFSIDQQRYNAQFGGQVFREIRSGRIGGMLKDVAYQIRTPEFWNAMDLAGGESTYFLYGTVGDGKGQPAQSSSRTRWRWVRPRPSLFQEGQGQAPVGAGVLRIHRHRPSEGGFRAHGVPFAQMQGSQLDGRFGIPGVRVRRPLERGGRSPGIPRLQAEEAQIEQAPGPMEELLLHHPLQPLPGLVEPPSGVFKSPPRACAVQ